MYINIIQLAESLGVSEGLIEDWIKRDGLPCIRDGARMSFDRAQVIEWAGQKGLKIGAGFLASGAKPLIHSFTLAHFLRIGGIWRNVNPQNVLKIIEQVIAKLSGINPDIVRMLTERIHAERGMNWAQVGEGVAMPHLRIPVALGHNTGVLAILMLAAQASLPQPPPDDIPVRYMFFFIPPSPRAHLEMVGQLSSHLARGKLKTLLSGNASDEDIFECLSGTGSNVNKKYKSS